MLLSEHGGTHLNVAIAWLKGEVTTFEDCIHEIVTPTLIAAAKARLEMIASGVIDE